MPEPAEPPAEGHMAFGVFGDGPYRVWEMGRFRRVIDDVNRSELEWLLHVGDLFWYPCSDALMNDRLERLRQVNHPVIYTPGDNEWADCHEEVTGDRDPLERLAAVRRIFFEDRGRTLGGAPMSVESQATSDSWSEFVENLRWVRGRHLFATVHIVGSGNATELFDRRGPRNDDEARRRTAAAVSWIEESMVRAQEIEALGVVFVFHAEMFYPRTEAEWESDPFRPILDAFRSASESFGGSLLLIHGDSHEFTVDQPILDNDGRSIVRITRIQTMGSPEIGWTRVVLDTLSGGLVQVDARRMGGLF